MAFVTPATVNIAKEYELLLPHMKRYTLDRALQNVNHSWKHFRPALVSVAPTAEVALPRASEYHIPVLPSADGLQYSFEVRFACSAASQNVTVSVDYTTAYVAGGASVWTAICSDVVVSDGVGGRLTTHQKANQVIPATAVALRVMLTAPAAGTRDDHHILAWPTPGDAVSGIQPSGFVSYDDTMMTSADRAAVHTEWVNRCKYSTVALLRDRRQCAYSFAQEYRTLPRWKSTDATFWRPLPPVRIWLPGQTGTVTLAARVIAEVDAGATADLVRLRQIGTAGEGKSVLFDASGAIESAGLEVKILGSGLLAYVDVELAIRTTTTHTTRVFAAMAWYTPGS